MPEQGDIDISQPPQEGTDPEKSFRVDMGSRVETRSKILNITVAFANNDISREQYEVAILQALGTERTSDGKVTLYHAAPIDSLVAIVKDGAIKPATQTGNRTWRTIDEDNSSDEYDLKKKGKIYLATKLEAALIARKIQEHTGRGAFVLLSTVDEERLQADEDTGATNWVDSLASLGTCSYSGEISKFEVIARTPPALKREDAIALAERVRSRPEDRQVVHNEISNRQKKIGTEEVSLVTSVNIDYNSLQVIQG